MAEETQQTMPRVDRGSMIGRAKILRARGAALADEPILSRMGKAQILASEVADFLVEMAEVVEGLQDGKS